MTANDGLQIGRLIDNEGFTDKRKKDSAVLISEAAIISDAKVLHQEICH